MVLRISCFLEMTVNPTWIAAVVQYTIDTRLAVLDVVIDGIREPAGERAMESEALVVDTCVKGKRFDLSIKCVAKIITHARLLIFVEPIAVAYIVVGGI